MSIYIKGMKMPTRCFSCPMCDVKNAEVNCAISNGSYIEYSDVDPQIAIQARPDWCPLIEVPPHGRLIDADALPRIKFHDLPYPHITPPDVDAESYERGWNDVIDAIVEDEPTIIEADE